MTADIRRDDAFPRLTPEQLARLRPLGRERRVADGEILFEQGATDLPFYVVLEGSIAIVLPSPMGEHIVVVHEQAQFAGDVDTLSGHRAIVTGRARGAGVVLEIERARLVALVQLDAELSEILLRAFIMRRAFLLTQGRGDLVVIGSRYCASTLRLREFLTRNGLPHAYIDVELERNVQAVLENFKVGVDDIPVVVGAKGLVLKRPTIEQVAGELGLNRVDDTVVRDVIVVGAGPAGLAAAVYAASEGLDVVVVEAEAPGGQAGTSSRIENYLGFPTGITGLALTGRAFVQAEKFGAEISVARTAAGVRCDRRPYRVELAGGIALQTRTIVIATGAKYRKPDIANLGRFEGSGVYYAATQLEAKLCSDEEVVVVGGANSAGQAAVFLSGCAQRVHMLVRGPGLAETMSRYLVRRIEETSNLALRTRTQIVELEGERALERVTCVDAARGARETLPARHVFMMTGADPNTRWLQGCVALDEHGFVETDVALDEDKLRRARWPLAREPYQFETSLPGVFAVGDARSRSVKRVAAAVGEGSACVQIIHRLLAE
ncbi:MAG TPA: FAD-dependent oxidoreductase [Haliangiales bacterium]|nr:FAD-dependent oxidoreductase [Haliangiales bacterium]